MRILALGDTHGRTAWKRIITKERFDKIIFIGDYFDTHENISAKQQKENFREIIAYKRAYSEKVILLLGNHDYHYLKGINETNSGYQAEQKNAIQKLLQPAVDKGLLQMCFAWDHLLFSHAGVTKTWCRNNQISEADPAEAINALFKTDPEAFEFTPGIRNDSFGNEVEQTPIWVRPESLLQDRVEGYTQIVGHTVQEKIMITDDVIFIDTLGTSGEYLIWEEGRLSVGKTKWDL